MSDTPKSFEEFQANLRGFAEMGIIEYGLTVWNAALASLPPQTAVGEGELPSFRITWREGAYYVSIPNYDGGEVVRKEDALLAVREAIAQRDDRDRHIELAYSALGDVNRSVYLFDHIQKLIAQRDETRKESAEILAAASQAQSDLGQDILDTEATLAALTAGKP